MLGGLEYVWRSQGYQASVTDNVDLWAAERDRIYEAGERSVALLGGSRILLGLEPREFERVSPGYEVAHLGINGLHPMAVLEDLAEDERFRGIAICAITAASLLPERWNEQAEYVRHYRTEFGFLQRYAIGLRVSLQSKLTVLLPQLTLHRAVRHLFFYGTPADPQYLLTHTTRFREAHYERMLDLPAHRAWRLARARGGSPSSVGSREWREYVARADRLARRIEARGGRVVFVRFPTSGEHWEADEWRFPKVEYWDVLARGTQAVSIHFKDVASLAGFECPDGSHLNYEDALEFTRGLSAELQRLGVLRPAGG